MGKKILFVLATVMLFSLRSAWATTVWVEWDPNSEADLAGYKVYYGTASRTEGPYAEAVVINDKNTTDLELALSSNTYYFSLTAFDHSGNESDFSVEVSVTIPPAGDLGKPGRPILLQ